MKWKATTLKAIGEKYMGKFEGKKGKEKKSLNYINHKNKK